MVTYDAASLESGLFHGTLSLRISDKTSLSPLTTAGFTATSARFEPCPSNSAWKRLHQPLRGNTSWTRDPAKLQELVQHVTGGWAGWARNERKDGLKLESDWISTSVDLEWCLFEISRRLVVLNRDNVELSVIRRRQQYSRRYKGAKMIHHDPAALIMKLKPYQVDEKDRQDALNFIRASSELLYYGRIFMKEIIETSEWTNDAPGFAIPEWCFVPRRYWKQGQSWTDRLVWNPRVDTAFVAMAKMEQRREELRSFTH
ncbi:hypothetical protein IAU59_003828 [Kwoniella sp. CBS 9459]